ncbi:MAG: 2'-5' RNA ligase family protein [Anaeroplasmataceae bacterium]|nr:2'-5' RNA ligase family protein [Anaeroplasmataceae bacterium]
MKKDKFLTIYAVLDPVCQEILTQIQNQILKQYNGTQTMGIPFHISLGSFPLEKKDMLIKQMDKFAEEESFSLELNELDHFNYQVIFAKPIVNEALINLHNFFEGNYADGFPWHPHVTLYCGKEEDGKEILKEYTLDRLEAKIVGIELGEFFPTHIIKTIHFK